jgi:hypothetical protein
MKLRRVSKSNLRSLLRHRLPNSGNSVPDVHHSGLARRVEETTPIGSVNPAPFPANGNRERLVKLACENR